jgi:hypothetical protein
MTLDEQEFRYVPNTSFRGPESLHVSWDVERTLNEDVKPPIR